MDAIEGLALAASLWWGGTLGFHLFSAVGALVYPRVARSPVRSPEAGSAGRRSMTVIVPVGGPEHGLVANVEAALAQMRPNSELLLAVPDATDSALDKVRSLLARYPQIETGLVESRSRLSANPKTSTLVPAYRAARHDLVALVDANARLAPGQLDRVAALAVEPGVGLVSAAPIATGGTGAGAALDRAFLNGYQARLLFGLAMLGSGRAQGKLLVFRRSSLEAVGGIAKVCELPVEDEGIRRLFLAAGHKVLLSPETIEHPLGHRTLSEAWARQVRWAIIRRWTARYGFVAEPVVGLVASAGAAALATALWNASAPASTSWLLSPWLVAGATALVWFSVEAGLCAARGWPLTVWSPMAWLARELLVPAMWISALIRRSAPWNGVRLGAAPAAR